ncbi:MAG: pgaB 2 [Firmicutes bacterium]|nr:pgaB 2 [Bacillota bacterium]
MKRKLFIVGTFIALIALIGVFYQQGRTPDQQSKPGAASIVMKSSPFAEAKAFPPGVPVLMYHSIGEEPNNDAVISKERFVEQMKYLHESGYHPVSLDDLHDYLALKKELPLKPVVITFDDGYRDTYEIAMPVLKQYGFRSVLFFPVGKDGGRLSWAELREMKASGMEIASHSYNHRSMDGLSRAEQAQEIQNSKKTLDQNLNQNTRWFCYPNGRYGPETLELLKANGFTVAVTTEPGWVKPGDHPLTLRRIWMGNSVDLKHFEERLTREKYSIL